MPMRNVSGVLPEEWRERVLDMVILNSDRNVRTWAGFLRQSTGVRVNAIIAAGRALSEEREESRTDRA